MVGTAKKIDEAIAANDAIDEADYAKADIVEAMRSMRPSTSARQLQLQ